MSHDNAPAANFIRNIIDEQNAAGKWGGRVETRFPPEPNGYLHLGHAKSIFLNFGLARDYGGVCHLRFDDTNPEKEEQEYVDAITESVTWLGFDWGRHLYFASNYFDTMYACAEYLIQSGHAYVDSLSAEDMRAYRGTLTEPGKDSPYRSRSAEENLDLFRKMRAGEFPDGAHVLRAKIDMASPNINMRDPAIYRIKKAHHHNTGDTWCIYPMYTYAHPIEDAIEHITHSICTLEFEDQRPFYDWLLDKLTPILRPECQVKSLANELLNKFIQHSEASNPNEAGGGFERLSLLFNKAGTLVNQDDVRKEFLSLLRSSEPTPALLRIDPHSKLGEQAKQFAEPSRLEEKVRPSWDSFKDALLEQPLPIILAILDVLRTNEPSQPHRWLNEEQLAILAACRMPQQIEFARLNLTYVVLSKRKLIQLVDEKHVSGWDDPRMPTLVGARRRGYTPEGFRRFTDQTGVSKSDGWIDYSVFEACQRDVLNDSALRRVAVLDPVKLIIDNYPAGQSEDCFAPNHPQQPELGKRAIPFSRELWIEREDFEETPPKGYFRLYPPRLDATGIMQPGNSVRLRYGYVVTCTGCDKDAEGNLTAVHCDYLPDTRSGTPGADSVKVKGNIHWVSAAHAYEAEVRLYDRLFKTAQPGFETGEFLDDLNGDSVRVIRAQLEPALKDAAPDDRFQFERHGYFVADRVDSHAGTPVFNRTVTLKDSWVKAEK